MQSFILKHCDCQLWMIIVPRMLNINVERHSGKNRKPLEFENDLEIDDFIF